MPQRKAKITDDTHEQASAIVKQVMESVRKMTSDTAERRFLFPYGINDINLQVTLGASTSITIHVQGPAQGDKPFSDVRSFFDTTLTIDEVLDAARVVSQDPTALADCNKFVKDVATKLGISIEPGANADRIVTIIQSDPWKPCGAVGDYKSARQKASDGYFVIAGMKSDDFDPARQNGHVAVVHGGEDVAHPGYPLASWGVLHGTGQFNASIRQSFPVGQLDRIRFHYYKDKP